MIQAIDTTEITPPAALVAFAELRLDSHAYPPVGRWAARAREREHTELALDARTTPEQEPHE